MANTEFNQLLSGSADIVRSGLLATLERRGVYVIEADEDPEDLTPGFVTHLAFNGVVFLYDDADATTPHDGVSCIVTADGRRFKPENLNGAQLRHWKVADKDLTVPPVSPALGDSYIVAAGATGAWAGEDKHVAVYLSRGWVFIVPATYDMATVVDEGIIYHYSAGGAWTSGIGALTIGANTVLPSALKYGRWGLGVVNQTTNAPPGSPADGDAYIIGTSPTGAWAGKARQLALYESSGWVYYVPVEGDHAYDRAQNGEFVFDGAAWASQVSGYANVKVSGKLDASGNISGTYSYSTTAPTTSNMTEQVSFAYTPLRAGATIEVDVSIGDVTVTAGSITSGQDRSGQISVGLFVDGGASAEDWARGPSYNASAAGASANTGALFQGHFRGTFIWTAPDTSSHTLKIFGSESGDGSNHRFNDVRIVVRELSNG